MPVYLSVPYAEKEEAKKYGAKWDPIKKLWYAPKGEKILIDKWPLLEPKKPLTELIGEDRSYGGNILFVDLVPKSCWFTNVRKCVDFSDWDRLRHFIYHRANYSCECCQEKTTLDAHERWHFCGKTKTQKLMCLIALCKPCHEVTHMGLANINGRTKEATEHLMHVTKMDLTSAQKHIEQAFALWEKRNRYKWSLDLSIIEKSEIKLAQNFNANEREDFSKKHLWRFKEKL